MKMQRLILLAFSALIILFISCQKEEPSVVGGLYVTVYKPNNSLAVDASIFNSAGKLAGKTDAFGTLMLSDLPAGSQKIFVNLNGVGAYEKEYPILAGKTSSIFVKLVAGASMSISPKIVRFSPVNSDVFTFGDTLEFKFKLNDSDSKPEDISVVIKSNLDGVLFFGQPDAQSYVTFLTSSMSMGIHTISVVSSDKDGFSQTITFTVNNEMPGKIDLTAVEKVGSSVSVRWSRYQKKDFLQYKVYVFPNDQNVPTLVSIITDAQTTAFLDEAPPLCNQAYYYVQVVNLKNHYSQSGTSTITEPGGPIYPFHASIAAHHPSLPIVYIADNEAKKLYALNYETRQMLASIAMDYSIASMHVADNGYGIEVYLPANDGYVKILDASNLSLIKAFKVGTSMTSITSNGKGLLFISCYNPKYPTNYVSCYSRKTTSILGGSNTPYLDGDELLDYVPKTNNRLIAISGGTSTPTLKYVNFSESGAFSTFTKDKYNGIYGISSRSTKMDPNGNYFISGSYGSVYTTDSNQNYLGRIPGGYNQFWNYAISPDGQSIFGAELLNKAVICVNFPSFDYLGELKTSGQPIFIFLFNGKLVVVSSASSWSWTNVGYGIEVKTIPAF